MKNKKSRELVNLILKIREDEEEIIRKLSLKYISAKTEWCLNEIEENHRLAITAVVSSTIKYMLEKQRYDCFYKTEDDSKFFVLGYNSEDNYVTAFNFGKIIVNDFDEIEKEITTDEERKVEYVDSTGTKFYTPTFEECDIWIEMILENLQSGNL